MHHTLILSDLLTTAVILAVGYCFLMELAR